MKREEQSYTRRREADQRASDRTSLMSEFALFVEGLKAGLESMDLASKRKILRLLIKRIEVKENDVQIVYKVQLHPANAPPSGTIYNIS